MINLWSKEDFRMLIGFSVNSKPEFLSFHFLPDKTENIFNKIPFTQNLQNFILISSFNLSLTFLLTAQMFNKLNLFAQQRREATKKTKLKENGNPR